MMSRRQGAEDVGAFGDLLRQGDERLELVDDDVLVAAEALELPACEDERLGPDERPEALVDRRRHDQVHLPELVLDEHEDDTVRGRRTLSRDREARDGDERGVPPVPEIAARDDVLRQARPEQRERMRPDGEAGQPVVGEHPLPRRLLGQLRRGGGRVERERQLPRLAGRARNARRPEGETELPEQLPTLAEGVARPGGNERLEAVAVELETLREVPDPGEGPATVALRDDSLGAGLAEGLDVLEADPYPVSFERALCRAAVDVDRSYLHPTPLRVPDERRWRIEAHRLRVQKRREELSRVVVA
jgi:hypothetical protein